MANSIFISNFLGLPVSTSGTVATITGSLTLSGVMSLANGTIGAPSLAWTTQPTAGWFKAAADDVQYVNSSGAVEVRQVTGFLVVKSSSAFAWSSTSSADGSVDTQLTRSAVGTVNVTTAFSAGGTAGVATFGPAGVTSITVKGGIITAIS